MYVTCARLIQHACAHLDPDLAADFSQELLDDLDDALDRGDWWLALRSAAGCRTAARQLNSIGLQLVKLWPAQTLIVGTNDGAWVVAVPSQTERERAITLERLRAGAGTAKFILTTEEFRRTRRRKIRGDE